MKPPILPRQTSQNWAKTNQNRNGLSFLYASYLVMNSCSDTSYLQWWWQSTCQSNIPSNSCWFSHSSEEAKSRQTFTSVQHIANTTSLVYLQVCVVVNVLICCIIQIVARIWSQYIVLMRHLRVCPRRLTISLLFQPQEARPAHRNLLTDQ